MATVVVAGLAAVGSAMIAAGGLISLGAAFGAFAIGAGLSLVSRALAPKPDLGTQMGGQSVMTRDAAHSRKIIYGRARIGGNVVYLESTGTDKKYLWLVIAVAGHEIDGYEEVWFNDEKIWENNSFVGTWGNYVTLYKYYGGTDNQTANAALISASNNKWTTNHRLEGTAYMVVKLTYDQEQFAQGLPNISTVVRGKKVWHPNHSSPVWSQNPALCVRDYLTDTKYGLGESSANIASINTAFGVCNEAVDLAAGGTQPRYTMDGVVDTANSIKSNIENMVGAMIGRLVYSGGKFEIHAGKYVAPTVNIDESMMIGEISVQTKQSRRNAYNGVKGVFLSEEDNYILADYPAQISSTYAAQDGDPIYLDMPLPYTVNNVRAQRMAQLALRRSRQQESITIPCNLNALKFKIGDNISVTNERLGYSAKVFEVVGYSMGFSSDQMVVNVDAIETASSIWSWDEDEEVFLGAGEVDIYDGTSTTAPASITVTADTFVSSDGTSTASFDVSWPDSVDAFVDHYVVEWKVTTNADYFTQATKASPSTIVGLDPDKTYDVRVKAVNGLAVSSSYTTAQAVPAADTTAPSLPTTITATAGLKSVSLKWTNPSERDFNNVEIFRSETQTGTYVEVSNVAGGFGAKAEHLDGGLEDETEYFYKLKSVDLTGNKTSDTDFNAQTAVSATTLSVGAGDVVTTTRITSSSSTAAPSDTVFSDFVGRDPIDGDIVYVTNTSVTPNAQKAYERINGAWVEQTNLISGDVIEDKSISNDNLSSNSVSPSKIIAHATSLVNPVSASGNVYRYGGYDDAGNIVNAIPSGIAVSFNSSENALSIANAQNSSVRTDSFPIDSNSVYKIKLQIRKTSTGGAWFVGANQYTSFTNGGTYGSNAQTAPIFGRWDINRNTMQGAANAYFAWKTSVTDTNYDEIVCFFLGSDVDINEVPNHLIPSDVNGGPYIQFHSGSTHGGLRILNWENGSTSRTLLVKNITVQRMTANSIVAENIDTTNLSAISADLGTVTAGSLAANLITGDVTEAFPIGTLIDASTGTSGTTTYQDFWIPAPSGGLTKRQKVELNFDFTFNNLSTTGYQVALYCGLQLKSKTSTGVAIGTVTQVSYPFSNHQYVSLVGNVLDKIDNIGGVAKTSNAAGTYGRGILVGAYYDASVNKTYVLVSNIQVTFATGDTMYFSQSKFESAGTFAQVYQGIEKVYIPANTNITHQVNISQYFGLSSTATNLRPYVVASTNMSNVQGTFERFRGTMENIA